MLAHAGGLRQVVRIEAMEKKHDARFAAVFDAIERLIAEGDDRKAAFRP